MPPVPQGLPPAVQTPAPLPVVPPVYPPGVPLQQINIAIPIQQTVPAPIPKTKWEVPRVVIGIMSMVLFFLFQIQSCAASAGEFVQSIFSDEAGTSGSTGYICSFFFLIAGIVGIVCRKNKGGAIAAGVIYLFCGFATVGEDFSYFVDLAFYCFLSFIFAGIMIIGGIAQRRSL
jgi:hypothetical protein